MNTITPFTPTDLITLHHGQPMTTSLKVAEVFGKQHKDVLRKIAHLDCSTEFNERNFALVEYVDGKGEKRPAYEMTKDGFIFVVMGFTGQLAARIKESYINAFNWMAEQLTRQQQATVLRIPAPNGGDNTYCGNLLVSIEYDQIVSCRPLPGGTLITNADKLIGQLQTPGAFTLEQLRTIADTSVTQFTRLANDLSRHYQTSIVSARR